MTTNSEKWYGYLLQQMAAECYFEGSTDFSSNDELAQILVNGNNRRVDTDHLSGLTRFTDEQVNNFLVRYRIVHQWSDNPNRDGNLSADEPGYLELDGQQILANSGFSATLIKNIDEDSEEYGTFTLSIRSSEYAFASNGGDKGRDVLGTDIGAIAGKGFALAQLDALERYVGWLRGTGMLSPQQKINLTGYSLGAHLVTLFTEMHPEQVIHAYTFNGAGRGEWDHGQGNVRDILAFYRSVLANPEVAASLATTAELIGSYVAAYLDGSIDPVSIYSNARYQWAVDATAARFRLLGNAYLTPIIDPGRSGLTNGVSGLITQIYGHAQNGDVEYVANSGIHGPSTAVFIEDQPNVEGMLPWGDQFDFGTTHSLTLLADSLAVMRIFERMDKDINSSILNKIFAAASAQSSSDFFGTLAVAEGDSLENVVRSLGDLLNLELVPMNVDRSGSGFANITNRNDFYRNLSSIETKLAGRSFHIHNLIDATPEAWVAFAKSPDGIAFRYALRELNPFVVVDDTGELYKRFEEGGTNAEELGYVPGSYTEVLNDNWIKDRSALLFFANDARTKDRTDANGALKAATGETIYSAYDAPGGRLTVLPNGFYLGEKKFVAFGNDADNELVGQGKNDRLYGGKGADLLAGAAGDDWLQGDEGADQLYGGDDGDMIYGGVGADSMYGENGADLLDGGIGDDYVNGGQGADQIYGREGSDTLDGGKGSDRLAGGEGLDFYVFRSGDGVDTIIDDDGLGHIIIDGRPIVSPAEGFKRIDNVWMSEGLSDPYSFHLDGSMETGGVLTISGLFHGQIRIENFKNGNLGIRLSDQLAKSEPDPPVNIVKVNSHTDLKSIGTDGVDHAVAIEDHSFFLGLGGNDVLGEIGNEAYNGEQLYGNGGNDLIIGSDVDLGGGSGGDFLVGGGGGDSIFGGAGSDALWGEGSAWFTPDAFRVDGFQYSLDGDGEGNGVGYFYNPIYSLVIDGVEFRLGGLSEALHWILGTTGSTDLSECFNDYLDGGDGDDWIYGMAGSDTLYGGDGDDVLVGDVDNPQFIYIGPGTSLQLVNLLGQYGDDYLDGGAGNDKLSDLSAGNDVLIGGEGNDILENIERTPNDAQNANYYAGSLVGDEVFSNYLDGGIGNDSLRSVNHYAGGHDELYGGVGDDKIVAAGIGAQFDIVGGDGDDEITIGAGVFTIVGGNGDDLYHIFGGIGFLSPDKAVIEDEDLAPENEDRIEVILFGSIGDLSLTRKADDLLIGIGGQIDWITVSNWFVGPEHKIEQFGITCIDSNFHPTDMVVWDIAAIERLAAWTGTTGPDVLIGEDGDDTILGNDGDDDIVAGKGNDHITGGSGNDELNGGDGDDTYFFSSGDGIDSIEDSGGFDTLILGEGITPDTVSVGFVDNELKIVSGPDLISLRWLPLLGYQIEQVKFKDGQIWDAAQLAQMAEKENDAPIVDNEITDQDCVEDEQFNFQIPTDAFDDDNGNSDLTLSATLSIGSALPPWLSFNPEFGLFSGMPGNADVGKISIKVVATDAEGASVFDIFDLTVVNANDSPIVLHPIDDQVAVDEMPYNLSIPSDLFEDPDIGDQLMYSISLESGLALPSWLAFDSATRMLSGTPSSLDIGSFSVKVKAIDSTGATASEQFEIVVNPSASLFLVGNATNQRLVGKSGADILDGGAGKDVLVGKRGNDTYFIDNLRDLIVEVAEEGNDLVYSSISYALPQNVENLTLTGPGNNSGTGNSLNNIVKGNSGVNVLKGMAGEDFIEAEGGEDYLYGGNGDDVLDGGAEGDHLYGNAGSDYLQGNVGRDYLYGGPGLDLLQGGGQDDYVYDTDGPGLLDGGDGNDSLTGRKGKNFFVGGVGDDTIATRSRENVIVFNLHDGKDVIAMRLTAQNTLSLGGGVAYVDLAFVKSSWDLVLNISSTDQITFKDWYLRQGNKSVTRLQVIAEAMPGFDHGGSNTLLDNKVEIFDFAALATAFDASGQVNGWALTNALLSAHLMGSDTAAIGGDLAYQYGLNGSLSSVGLTAAQDVLKAPQFGTSAQALRPLQDLQQGQIRLQ